MHERQSVGGHVVQSIAKVHVTCITGTASLSLIILLNLLNTALLVGQVAHSSGVSPANGALFKVALQNVTSGESIAAKHTHVRAFASGCIEK